MFKSRLCGSVANVSRQFIPGLRRRDEHMLSMIDDRGTSKRPSLCWTCVSSSSEMW